MILRNPFVVVSVSIFLPWAGQAATERDSILERNVPVNYAPGADPKEVVAIGDRELRLTLTGFDAYGDALTFSIVNLPSHGQIVVDPGTGLAVYSPSPGYRGRDQFSFQTSDGDRESDVADVLVVVDDDSDGDEIGDSVDNCPWFANPRQEDRGGVGGDSGPDGIGDACQCGDVNLDGRVTGLDGTLVGRAALRLNPYPNGIVDLPAPELCDVGGTAGCTGLDGTLIKRASLGLPPGVQQVCPAAGKP